MNRLQFATLVAPAILAACLDDSAAPPPRSVPEVAEFTVSPSPTNVLAATVSATVTRAESVAVRFRLATVGAADSVTPAVPAAADAPTLVPLLGLLPGSSYAIQVIAYGDEATTTSASVAFATGSLPSDLPSYTASGSNPTPGYVVMAAGMYGLVIDNSGRVVWYHRFDNGPWLNFMAQPNDRYVARLVTSDPADIEPWVEIDALGNVTRTLGCGGNLQARFHDMIAETDGGYWILCDETRTVDLSAHGGHPAARVTGTVVQRVSAAGDLTLHWSAFENFEITDLDAASRSGASVNWTHGNALALTEDGNLLVSFRNLNEITKIDSRTGDVLWRFGGRRNQFLMIGAERPFAGQHSVRLLTNGDMLLLDNVGDSVESRAQHWVIDDDAGIARLAESFGSKPPVRTQVGGSVQPLRGDRVLVSFGTEGRVEEYDAHGNVLWRLEGSPGYVFRAQRIRSLYRPGAPFPSR